MIQSGAHTVGKAVETVHSATTSATHMVKDVWNVTIDALESGHEAFKEGASRSGGTTQMAPKVRSKRQSKLLFI